MRKYTGTLLNTNGQPQVGASVKVVDSNTTNLATLFDDGGTIVTNPLTTNATGQFSFQVVNGLYDLLDGSNNLLQSKIQIYDVASVLEAKFVITHVGNGSDTIIIDGWTNQIKTYSLYVGGGGPIADIKKYYFIPSSWGTISANSSAYQDFAIPGITPSNCTPIASPIPANTSVTFFPLTWSACPYQDLVRLILVNPTASPVTPPSSSWNIVILNMDY